jgi:hypothetical protein
MKIAETEGGRREFPSRCASEFPTDLLVGEISMNRHDALFLVVLLVAAATILVAAPMVVSMAVRSGADALGRMAIDNNP